MSGPDLAALERLLDPAAQAAAMGLDEYVTVNPDGTITQALEHPYVQMVDRGGGEKEEPVTELTYARPKGRHVRQMATMPEGKEVEALEAILVELAGVQPKVFADKLDAVDYGRALAAFGLFFPKPQPPTAAK